MGGEGAMLHMINTLKENRRLKKSIRKHFKPEFKQGLKNGLIKSTHQDWELEELDISKEELQIIIEKIRKKVQRQNQIYRIVGFILFSSFLIIIIYYWKYLF